ncbi:unnamed protein product [Bursaphelenchus xylophilus]|uniref:(pine wood nematode) hypothetical protein n=1 Tax=Bursaphelenchus xylophilus TaxID=6326 RepID=A0A1I7SE55_BURXY|nr:unnamed protein product [Bursaphelenchus xylophilus]CAG9104165.1 unnamed protein product [Bursaphelenchus xylophilus]
MSLNTHLRSLVVQNLNLKGAFSSRNPRNSMALRLVHVQSPQLMNNRSERRRRRSRRRARRRPKVFLRRDQRVCLVDAPSLPLSFFSVVGANIFPFSGPLSAFPTPHKTRGGTDVHGLARRSSPFLCCVLQRWLWLAEAGKVTEGEEGDKKDGDGNSG